MVSPQSSVSLISPKLHYCQHHDLSSSFEWEWLPVSPFVKVPTTELAPAMVVVEPPAATMVEVELPTVAPPVLPTSPCQLDL